MKIPFERTIAASYRFAFSNILSVIGIAWFPYLLLIAVGAGAIYLCGPQIYAVITAVQAGSKPDPAKLQALFRSIAPIYGIILPVALVTSAMVTVGTVRKALGLHPGPVFVFFSLGGAVWRLIGAYILMIVLFYGLAIVSAAAVAAVWFVLHRYAPEAEGIVTVLLAIVAVCFCIYAVVRTSFLLPAVVVAENHIGIRRSWHLGRGNFWRIVGILLLIYIPVAFAVSTITSSVLQLFLGPSMGLPTGASSPAEMQAALKAMLNGFMRAAPYYAAIQLVQLILLSGLTAGAVASAYQSVTESAKASPDLKASA